MISTPTLPVNNGVVSECGLVETVGVLLDAQLPDLRQQVLDRFIEISQLNL